MFSDQKRGNTNFLSESLSVKEKEKKKKKKLIRQENKTINFKVAA